MQAFRLVTLGRVLAEQNRCMAANSPIVGPWVKLPYGRRGMVSRESYRPIPPRCVLWQRSFSGVVQTDTRSPSFWSVEVHGLAPCTERIAGRGPPETVLMYVIKQRQKPNPCRRFNGGGRSGLCQAGVECAARYGGSSQAEVRAWDGGREASLL